MGFVGAGPYFMIANGSVATGSPLYPQGPTSGNGGTSKTYAQGRPMYISRIIIFDEVNTTGDINAATFIYVDAADSPANVLVIDVGVQPLPVQVDIGAIVENGLGISVDATTDKHCIVWEPVT